MTMPSPSPEWVKEARETLGLSRVQFARMIGYVSNGGTGDGNPLRVIACDLEAGRRRLREPQRRLVEAYLLGYRAPDWPGDL
jgi:hypothetical protein